MVALIRRSPRRSLSMFDPFYRPLSLLEELELLPETLFGGYRWPSRLDTGLIPRIDMHEMADELVIRAELPGVSKEDIDIRFEDSTLTIEAEKKVMPGEEELSYYTCERCFGRYHRHIVLPVRVDADKATSTYDAGVLEIRLPKAEEAKAKHIEVKVR